MLNYYIGLDVGGTDIKSAAVSTEGKIVSTNVRPTQSKSQNHVVLGNILSAINEIIKSQGDAPLALGFGVPGAIRFTRGVVTRSPHFPNWTDYNIRKELSQKLDIPFFIDNDANCAALGELWLGAGRGSTIFCLLTLGTGIGGGMVIDGKVFRGADGMAAEFGHIIVEPEGEPCGCGGRGCLEKYVSAHSAVLRALGEFDSEAAQNLRAASHGSRQEVTARLLYDLARGGDALCLKIFKRMGRYLGIGFADLVNVFNMEKIIIGGGMLPSWDLLIPPAIEEMKKRAFKVPAQRVEVVPALCGGNAGVLGAAYLAKTGVRLI